MIVTVMVKKAMPQWALAIFRADPESAIPITMATEPVNTGGSTLSRAALPIFIMSAPM
jgi:hypothetical protein